VVAGAPWHAMWSNEKPSAFERVGATGTPRKKLAWGSGVFSQQHCPHPPPLIWERPTNPTAFEGVLAVAPSRAMSSNQKPSALERVDAALTPHPPPLTSYQQRPVNRTALEGVPRAAPRPAMWGSEKPPARERVDSAPPLTKKLVLRVQGTNGTDKSPGFRMHVDSDDGISDDEGGSAVAPGPGCNRKRNQIQLTRPLSKQPKKKQKHKEPPKHALSLDKLMEFISTWRQPCLRHPDESDLVCFISR
jgi:hypothetical protein